MEDWVQANTSDDKATVVNNCLISWCPPEVDWVKLNVDGSMSAEMNSIAGGGVVRDRSESWVTGFALKIVTGSVLEAELWGILEGLKLVWQMGFRKVVVDSDSKSAVELLSKGVPSCHPLFSII